MPYKSEKINIVNTIWDRRQKLSDDQKEYMRFLREEYGYSYNQLAAQFGVSKRLAQFICNPEKYEKARAQRIERGKDGRYKPTKEEWAETMRDHRHYKQKLYLEEKIGTLNLSDMDKYNYREAIVADIEQYLAEHYTLNELLNWIEDAGSTDDVVQELNDTLWTEDSVTGNASGSYTFSTWQAEENICHNLDLLAEAIEEFGGDMDVLKNGAESCDVTIRCYLLSECIDHVIQMIEDSVDEPNGYAANVFKH